MGARSPPANGATTPSILGARRRCSPPFATPAMYPSTASRRALGWRGGRAPTASWRPPASSSSAVTIFIACSRYSRSICILQPCERAKDHRAQVLRTTRRVPAYVLTEKGRNAGRDHEDVAELGPQARALTLAGLVRAERGIQAVASGSQRLGKPQ